jgi:hypothetical protein
MFYISTFVHKQASKKEKDKETVSSLGQEDIARQKQTSREIRL